MRETLIELVPLVVAIGLGQLIGRLTVNLRFSNREFIAGFIPLHITAWLLTACFLTLLEGLLS